MPLKQRRDRLCRCFFVSREKFFQFFLKKSFFCQDVVKVCMILCNHRKGTPRIHRKEQTKNFSKHKSGGAYKTIKYALKHDKSVRDLADRQL